MTPERPTSRRRTSSVIMMAALFDLLVMVPYTYWQLHGVGLTIAGALEGIAILTLLGIALHLRRRGM